MGRLIIALLLLLGVVIIACSGSRDTEEQVSLETNGNTEIQSNSGANEQNPDQGLRCPGISFVGYESQEDAAMAAACESADSYGLSIEFDRLEVEEEQERNATIRIVGFVPVCDSGCPQEMEVTFDVFKNTSGKWQTTSSYNHYVESRESKQNKVDQRLAQLKSANVSIRDKNPTVKYGGFFDYVEVDRQVELRNSEFLHIEVLAEIGGKELVFRGIVNLNGETAFTNGESSSADGSVAQIKSYRLLIYQGFGIEPIYADWKPLN